MNPTDPSATERDQFEALFRATARRVHAYVRRHIAEDLVDEVVSEVYLVAWRRREKLIGPDPMPWLLVTARHTVAHHRRRAARGGPRVALEDVASEMASYAAPDGLVVDRAVALAALAELTEREREAVLLVAWDGLDHPAAAAVAGCSVRAFTVRLERARRRLRAHTEVSAEEPDRAAARRPATHPTRLIEESR